MGRNKKYFTPTTLQENFLFEPTSELYPRCFHKEFPHAVSYNRFVELMPRVFCKMMLFMKLYAFGKCTGITFVDSTMIPVCHNVKRYFNKVFSGLAKNGKGTMGWCHGFKLHLLCNDSGEVITFCLTRGPTWMTGIAGCGMYSMERSLLIGDILSKNSSKAYSVKVFWARSWPKG